MTNWKLLKEEFPNRKQIVLFRWQTNSDISVGYWNEGYDSAAQVTFPIFIINDSYWDGEEPTSWCEIPE